MILSRRITPNLLAIKTERCWWGGTSLLLHGRNKGVATTPTQARTLYLPLCQVPLLKPRQASRLLWQSYLSTSNAPLSVLAPSCFQHGSPAPASPQHKCARHLNSLVTCSAACAQTHSHSGQWGQTLLWQLQGLCQVQKG